MKKNFTMTGIAMIIAFLVACSAGDSPKSVTEIFLKALNRLDYDAAKKYSTEDTGKLLDMMTTMSKLIPDSANKSDHKVEILTEKIDGDKATVSYKSDDKGEETLNLVKVEGKWKVAMSKDSMGGGDSGASADSTSEGTYGAVQSDSLK